MSCLYLKLNLKNAQEGDKVIASGILHNTPTRSRRMEGEVVEAYWEKIYTHRELKCTPFWPNLAYIQISRRNRNRG
ncbi:MAG: hypothetical protein R2822_16745 [Spirosomataceae bacterium]